MMYNEGELKKIVATVIAEFYEKRIKGLDEINPKNIFGNKNPYLFRATCGNDLDAVVSSILKAQVSSSDETLFGNGIFEPIAIYLTNGNKSESKGSDVAFTRNGIRHFLSVKSGTKWANSSSMAAQKKNFQEARRAYRSNNSDPLPVKCMIGSAYGRKDSSDGDVDTIAGQSYWEYISGGDTELYKKLIVIIGECSETSRDRFNASYQNAKNKMFSYFTINFCRDTGEIDWEKYIESVSSKPEKKESQSASHAKKKA